MIKTAIKHFEIGVLKTILDTLISVNYFFFVKMNPYEVAKSKFDDREREVIDRYLAAVKELQKEEGAKGPKAKYGEDFKPADRKEYNREYQRRRRAEEKRANGY